MDAADIAHRFAYHPPRTPERSEQHERVRQECRNFAGFLNHLLPEGREKALAITKLEEAMFWANASIARAGSEDR
ncbi:Acb2/Tad1 domain-containing protein [Streptomyces sp. NPDC004069]